MKRSIVEGKVTRPDHNGYRDSTYNSLMALKYISKPEGRAFAQPHSYQTIYSPAAIAAIKRLDRANKKMI
jgi:hypothetical protein